MDCNPLAKRAFHFDGRGLWSAVFTDEGETAFRAWRAGEARFDFGSLLACSGCAGDYEDPDVTAWDAGSDTDDDVDGEREAKKPRRDAGAQSEPGEQDEQSEKNDRNGGA
jgi:hypothetical protein